MNSKLFVLLIIGTCCWTWSCGPNKKPDRELIVGTWKLDQAMRNGKITNSLEGTYLKFSNDKSFDSNILGDTSSFSAQVGNGKIKIDHDLLRLFEIEELTDSTMKLQFEINDMDLLLVFYR